MNNKQNNNELVAFSKSLARAKKVMNVTERKLFFMILEKISWNKTDNDCTVILNKMDIIHKLKSEVNASDRSAYLRREFQNLAHHSEIRFTESDDDWMDGFLIIGRKSDRKNIKVFLNPYYMPLLQDLGKNKEYITMWASDIYDFKTDRAYIFYEYLRLHSDTRRTNKHLLTTKQIKQLFDIPEDAYMRIDKRTNKESFNRSEFEKKIIEVVCEELAKSRMIHLIRQDDGKLYIKKKKGQQVQGYEFEYIISDNPQNATAEEILDINQEPELIKIAKDIKKSKKKKTKNDFNEFPQNDYDFEELEKDLLNN